MKFYERVFVPSKVPPWSDKYLDFKSLKIKILQLSRQAQGEGVGGLSPKDVIKSSIIRINRPSEELNDEDFGDSFFELLKKETSKVHRFYNEQLTILFSQFDVLVGRSLFLQAISSFTPNDSDFYTTYQSLCMSPGSQRYKQRAISITEEISVSENGNSNTVESPLIKKPPEEHRKNHNHARKLDQLKQDFKDFYRNLLLLEHYCTNNYEAVKNLMRKFEKYLGSYRIRKEGEGNSWLAYFSMNDINFTEIASHINLKKLIDETETIFANNFYDGSRDIALPHIKGPKIRPSISRAFFSLGITGGLSLAMILYVIYILSVNPVATFPQFNSVIRFYRMIALGIVLLWCWGFNFFVWTRRRVNYVYILELDHRGSIRYQHILEFASVFTFCLLLSFCGYLTGALNPRGLGWLSQVPWQFHLLWFLFASFIIFIVLNAKCDFWFITTLLRIVSCPAQPVAFRDFFIADQLISLSILFKDLGYSACFFSYEAWESEDLGYCETRLEYYAPILAALPAVWRLVQCFRRYYDTGVKANLINAGKYSATFPVIIFGSLPPTKGVVAVHWIVGALASLYSFAWDLKMDWNLLHIEGAKAPLLRRNLIYKHSWLYYLAAVLDLMLRYTWSFTVSSHTALNVYVSQFGLDSIFGVLEVFRRAMWNLFRLENEQLDNIEKYRDVNTIVPPSTDREL